MSKQSIEEVELATPRPWRWVVDANGKYGIYYPGGVFIAIADSRGVAERIVRSVNAHSALVDVLVEISGNYGEPVSARKATRALAALASQPEVSK